MNTTLNTEAVDIRKLLFISYAYEDEVFARWLARKLALYGYGLWFDQIEILGGESWVKDVDIAIKENSFRVLGLLSSNSINKENPRKERTLAQQIAKKTKTEDFLITLNLDGTDPDWTLSDISWISFQKSWAHGLRRLLKKLDAIEAPKIHEGNPAIARAELCRGEDLISQKSEELLSNWLPFTDLPDLLRVYDAPELKKEDLSAWPCFLFDRGKVAALSPPPSTIEKQVQETKEVHYWPSIDEIRRSATHSIIVQILNKTVRMWLKNSGCIDSREAKVTYIPDPFREESIYRYTDADGSNRRISTSGKITIKKPSAPPEKVIYHPGVRYRARKTDAGGYVLELTPSVALFDNQHQPIEGKKIGPRRKKLSRGWYNPHWRKRMTIFAQLLQEEAENDNTTVFSLGAPTRINCDRSLLEENLAPPKDSSEEEILDDEVEVGIDEMEDWKE